MERRLLLIDTSIASYDKIVSAVGENVTPVVFDSTSDTYATLLEKVTAVSGAGVTYPTIGLVQHGSVHAPMYSIVRTESPGELSEAIGDAPTMASWQGIIEFFTSLKETYYTKTVDLISCLLYANPAWVAALNQLESRTGLNFRASRDATGNLTNGGNWVMESDNVNIEGIYFTEAIREFTGLLLYRTTGMSTRMMVSSANKVSVPMISESNPVNGMVQVIGEGSVITFGYDWGGSNSSSVSTFLGGRIKSVTAGYAAFAAINADGAVATWGDVNSGGNSSAVASLLSSGVKAITSTFAWDDYGQPAGAFAALKTDGSVVTWGSSAWGGDSSSVASSINSGVVAIATTNYAFAALKSNGSVITWGNSAWGGDSTAVGANLLSGVVSIASSEKSFAALKSDGSVITWGNGIVSPPSVSSGVTTIAASLTAFAAIKEDGSVVSWGDQSTGGNSSARAVDLSSGIIAIAASGGAFAALRSDGAVITWGYSFGGGDSTFTTYVLGFQQTISIADKISSGVKAIASTQSAFAALKEDGTVISWGLTDYGGVSATNIKSYLVGEAPELLWPTKVIAIASTYNAFAALTSSGSVSYWGASYLNGFDASLVSTGVTSIFSAGETFAAVRSDRKIISWGTFQSNLPVDDSIEVIAASASAMAVIKGSPSITASTTTPDFLTSFTLSVASPKVGATYQWYKNYEPISGANGIVYTIESATTKHHNGVYFMKQTLNGTTIDSTAIFISVKSPSVQVPMISATNPVNRMVRIIGQGELVSWGVESDMYSVTPTVRATNVIAVTPNRESFAAIKHDGTVVTWGKAEYGGDSSSVSSNLTGVVAIAATIGGNSSNEVKGAFAALKSNGSVVTWGDSTYGGDSSAVTSSISTGVIAIASTRYGFAALKSNGSVVTWGDVKYGGKADVLSQALASGVVKIASNHVAFAALKSDGSVVSWGIINNEVSSGDVSVMQLEALEILGSSASFAAIKQDGSVVAWGLSYAGGSSPTINNAVSLSSTDYAFAVVRSDGSVIAWGDGGYGGSSPSITGGVISIASNARSFAALKSDGSIVSWGNSMYGGSAPTITNAVAISSNVYGYAALTDIGRVIVWGNISGISNSAQTELMSNVVKVVPSSFSFSAIKKDGLVVSIGAPNLYQYGPAGASLTGVVTIIGSDTNQIGSYAAIKASQSIATTTNTPSYMGQFTLSVVSPTQGATYKWYRNDRPIEGATNTTYTASSVKQSTHGGIYFVRQTLNGISSDSNSTIIVIDAPPASPTITVEPIGGSIIAGNGFALTVSNVIQGATYEWYKNGEKINGQIGTTYTVARSTVAADAGDYISKLTYGDVTLDSNSVNITINPPNVPVITSTTTEPAYKSNFTLSVTSPYENATYQWYKNSSAISGATGTSYNVASATTTEHAGNYVVRQIMGGYTDDSNVISILVGEPSAPVITVDTATPLVTTSFTLSVLSPPTGATYTWYKDGVLITDSSGALLKIDNVSVSANSGTYTTKMLLDNRSITSNSITITVATPSNPSITATTTTPEYKGGFTLNISSPLTGATFQWYYKGTQISNATGSSYTVASATATQHDGSYYAVQSLGGYDNSSNPITITVKAHPSPVITSNINYDYYGKLTVGYKESFTLSTTAIENVTYEWLKDGTPIQGATSNTYTVNEATYVANYGSYTLQIVLDGKTLISNSITMNVGDPLYATLPDIYTTPTYSGSTFTPPFRSNIVLYSRLVVPRPEATYDWYKNQVKIPDISGSTYTIDSVNAMEHDGVYSLVAHIDGRSFSSRFSVTISVLNPTEPVITTTTNTPAYGGSFTLSVSSPDPSGSYQWYRNNESLVGSTGTSYTVNSANAVNNDGVYKVVMTLDGKNISSNTVTISVGDPMPPIISTSTLSPNYGEAFSLSVSSPLSGVQYQWYKGMSALVGENGTTYTVNSASVSQHNGLYKVVLMANGKSFDSNAIQIAVNVAPPIVLDTGTATNVIAGGSFTLNVSVIRDGATYQWYKNNNILENATTVSYSVSNATRVEHEGVYRVTVTYDGATSNSNELNIEVFSLPVITTQPVGGTMFYNGLSFINQVILNVVATQVTSYQWYKGDIIIPNATSSSYSVTETELGAHLYQVRLTNPAGSIISSAVFVYVQDPLMPGGESTNNRVAPTINVTKDEANSILLLDYKQLNPTFDLTEVRVELRQISALEVLLSDPVTGYPPANGTPTKFDQITNKIFDPSVFSFSDGISTASAPYIQGQLQINEFYPNCKYIVIVTVTFANGDSTGWSDFVTNTNTQYNAALSSTTPNVHIQNKSTHNSPEILVSVSQELVQSVRNVPDEGNVVHMRFYLYKKGSDDLAKTFDISRPFEYRNGIAYGNSYILRDPHITFDTEYQVWATVYYRNGIITNGDTYTITPISNPLDEAQTITDIYEFIRNDINTANFDYIFTYYQNSLEYIRSTEQIAYRLSKANEWLITRGVITASVPHAEVISHLFTLIENDTENAAINNSYFSFNGDGHLYRLILWMMVDSNTAAVTLLDIKKYVVGQNAITDFNISDSSEILTGQFRRNSTMKFHKFIRINRFWNNNRFTTQLTRIDPGAFDTGATVIMRDTAQYEQAHTSFEVDVLGNIVLDPVHFPHILNKKEDPSRLGTFYSDKLFLIGRALMPGAPYYTSFNKKMVNMAGEHVLNLSGDAIYTLTGEVAYQFISIASSRFTNNINYRYDRDTGILYDGDTALYKAIHTFYTPIATGNSATTSNVFNSELGTWDYKPATTLDYSWFVQYIPPNYFRYSAITEAIVSWKLSTLEGIPNLIYYLPPLRDVITIGTDAFPPNCTIYLPTPYLDNAFTKITRENIEGGSILDIFNVFTRNERFDIVKGDDGPISLRKNIAIVPTEFFLRSNLSELNIRREHQLLRIPSGSIPIGCNLLRDGRAGTVLPGRYGYPFSDGFGPSIYTDEISNISGGLVVFSGIVYKNYDTVCEIMWLIESYGYDIIFPPVPLRVPDFWAIGFKDMYIQNVDFTGGSAMCFSLGGTIYYSGITYTLVNRDASVVIYDRIPTMTDTDRLTGTVRILNTGLNDGRFVKNLPDIFKTYTGIDLLVLPSFMSDITTESMIDGQQFECDKIQWKNERALGYPVLLSVNSVGDRQLLEYVKLYDSIFENNIELRSISNGRGGEPVKTIGNKAFKGCSALVSVNYQTSTVGAEAFKGCSSLTYIGKISGDINDEAFYGTTSLKSLELGETINKLGSRVFFNSGIETLTIDARSGITLTSSTFEGATNLRSLTVTNISSSFLTNTFSGLIMLKSLSLSFTDSANAAIGQLNSPNLERVVLTGNITSLDPAIFQGCSKLKSVTINGKITNLSDSMFNSAQESLEYLYVNFVGDAIIDCQFKNFRNLKEVHYIGTGNAVIHPQLFTGCSMLTTFENTLNINSNITDTSTDVAFGGCATLKELSLVFSDSGKKTVSTSFSGLTALEKFSMKGGCIIVSSFILSGSSNLKYIEIDGELQGSITRNALGSVRVFIVKYGGTNSEISDYSFKDNVSLETLVIKGSITRIGIGAFYYCQALTSMSLPEGLEKIDDFAFARSGISGEVVIPSTVTYLGTGYFISCPNLKKITYNCSVLYFMNPTQVSELAWNSLRAKENISIDLYGNINVIVGRGETGLLYTRNDVLTVEAIPESFCRKFINNEKFVLRKNKFESLLSYMKSQYRILSSKTSWTDAETKLMSSLYLMITTVRDNSVISLRYTDIMDNILTMISDNLEDISNNTDIYNKIKNILLPELNAANISIFDSTIGAKTETMVRYNVPHNNIRIKINSLDMKNIDKDLIIIKEGDDIYAACDNNQSTINLKNDGKIEVNGNIRINITELLGSHYASILLYISNNIDTISSYNSIHMQFNGINTIIKSLTNINNSQIDVSSETFVAYDFGMREYIDTKVTINATKSITLFDQVFFNWTNSHLIINTQRAICGVNLFFNSLYTTVTSNVELVNKTNTVMYDFGDKTLLDISSIIVSATGVDIGDTRNFKVETFIPANVDNVSNSFIVLRFQEISTLTEHAIIMQPEDWFWCFRTTAYDPDFTAGDEEYCYMPENAERNADGTLKIENNAPSPPEYCGLFSSFTPTEFTYNGIRFVNTTGRSSGSNVIVRAMYTTNPEARAARLESIFKQAIGYFFDSLSILVSFIPAPGLNLAVGALVDAAGLLAQYAWDKANADELNQYTYEFENREIAVRNILGRIAISFRRIGRGIATIVRVIRGVDNRVVDTIVRTPGIDGGVRVLSNNPLYRPVTIDSAVTTLPARPFRKQSVIEDEVLQLDVVNAASNADVKGLLTVSRRTTPTSVSSEIAKVKIGNPKKEGEVMRRSLPPPETAEIHVTRIKDTRNVYTYLPTAKRTTPVDIETIIDATPVVKGKSQALPPAAPSIEIPVASSGNTGGSATKRLVINDKADTRPADDYVTTSLNSSINFKRVSPGTVMSRKDITRSLQTLISRAITISAAIETSLLRNFSNRNVRPISQPQYNSFIQELHGLFNNEPSEYRSDIVRFISSYLDRTLTADFSDIGASIMEMSLIKDIYSIDTLNSTSMKEIAAYTSYIEQYKLRALGDHTDNNYISEDLTTVMYKAATIDRPPYLFPLTAPSRYNQGAREDFVHHFTSQKTNYVYSPIESDPNDYENGAERMASPLMARRNYMFNSTYLREPRRADDPHTSSYDGNTILICNSREDEVYLGSRKVTYIISGDEAPNNVFCGASLLNIIIPEGVTRIGDYAYCSTDGTSGNIPFTISSITLPSTLSSIGKKAFYRASVSNLFYPESIRLIGDGAFQNCGLVNAVALKKMADIDTPISVSITMKSTSELTIFSDNMIFKGFQEARVVEANGMTRTFNGTDNSGAPAVLNIIGTGDIKISDISKVERIRLFKYYIDAIGVEVNDSIITHTSNNVSSFQFRINREETTTSISLPTSITLSKIPTPTVDNALWNSRWDFYVGDGDKYKLTLKNSTSYTAFSPTKVIYSIGASKITRGRGLRSTGSVIATGAFSGNTSLTTFIAPADTTEIGAGAFDGCTNLASIELPNTLTTIGDNVFANTGLQTVTIPPSVTTIGSGVFAGATSLTSVSLPSSLTTVPTDLFTGASALTTVSFSDGVPATITPSFFNTLPPSVTRISVPPTSVLQIQVLLAESSVSGISVLSGGNSITNSLPSGGNPYRATRGAVVMYTREAVDALVSGVRLPTKTEVECSPAPIGSMMTPTGRRVIVMGNNRLHLYKFSEVKLISGGMPAAAQNGWNTGWICTWSAEGSAPVL